ncbi:DUF4044 domain-containing protein [Fundicoccus culcitae]|uniref:DUF4044 domain-containing protein n=1 Tax=Fundicoccus culcitae TaxID=2969821 RepID=A0ABY5P769_9LACT|nr:DUF4044 domain-containing protein [Fundicoccus culcitae]UUX34577.1 DUF4044 domain-containing protein [Fundicoccus culcitae]
MNSHKPQKSTSKMDKLVKTTAIIMVTVIIVSLVISVLASIQTFM